MKRLLLLLVVCCTAFACEQNDAVPPQTTTKQVIKSKYRTLDEAIDIAEKSVSMLGEQTRATKRSINRSRVRAVLNKQVVTRSAAADTLIYIINFDDSAGFALIPRSTSKPELLAVTEKGNYDGGETDNEGFNIYMSRAYEWIVDSTHDGQPIDTTFNPGVGGGGIGDQVITEWKSEEERNVSGVDPMCTFEWNQGRPYSFFCLTDDGVESKAGCGAISIGTIMAYYEYPNNTNLTLTYPITNIQSIPLSPALWADFKRHPFQIENHYYLGALVREIGHRLDMTYEINRATCSDSKSVDCLTSFGYVCDPLQIYSKNKVLTSLQNGYLVKMSGLRLTDNREHSWVVDGSKCVEVTTKEWQREQGQTQWTLVSTIYTITSYLHFNWGHGGNYSGYYLTNRNSQGGVGGTYYYEANIFEPSSDSTAYNNNVWIIPNIKPNTY